ncbi:MAG: long-chain fatty acid--CoA ligase [bacterium]|nr:long-chain fatty acid--CoA ligase [bacterium]
MTNNQSPSLTGNPHSSVGLRSNAASSLTATDERILERLRQSNSLPELFQTISGDQGQAPCLRFRNSPAASWEVLSWSETMARVAALASWLNNTAGVKKGDRVAIFSSTRAEWVIADLAILYLGAISTPVYQTVSPGEAGFILWESEANVVFVENEELFAKINACLTAPIVIPETEEQPGGIQTISLGYIISFEKVELSGAVGCLHLEDIVKTPASEQISSLTRNDLASIVYTSGTTGAPKGVIQSHENHLAMLQMVAESRLVGSGNGVFLFLPLAHSFARLIAYAALSVGGELIFPTVVDNKRPRFVASQMFSDLSESSPLIFPSVPRLFEKLMSGLKNPGGGPVQRLIAWGILNHRATQRLDTSGADAFGKLLIKARSVSSAMLVRLAMKKIFGKNLAYCISGGAPIGVSVLRFFESLGVQICEGYGLTETTPAMSSNTPEHWRIGSVGRLFPDVEVKINEQDGEILVRGANVALGYWKRPHQTAEAWIEGWFHTGDIGRLDPDGYLYITDRKKSLIVTAGGKNISPANIEQKIKTIPYISNVMVYGDNKPYLTALITLETDNIREWLRRNSLEIEQDNFAASDVIAKLLRQEIDSCLDDFAKYEQIAEFAIIAEDFTPDNGMLTPTLKLKRKTIAEKYATEIDALYPDDAAE